MGFELARKKWTSTVNAGFALPTWQFRTTTHDLDIGRIAEQAGALLGGQLLDDAELLQVAERLVDRGRGWLRLIVEEELQLAHALQHLFGR